MMAVRLEESEPESVLPVSVAVGDEDADADADGVDDAVGVPVRYR